MTDRSSINNEYSNKNWRLNSDYIWLFQNWRNPKYPAVCYQESKRVWITPDLKEIKSERSGRRVFKHPNSTYENYLEQLIEVIKLKGSQQKDIMELPYSIGDIPDDYEYDKQSKLYCLIQEYHQATAPVIKTTPKKEVSFELNEENLIEV